MNLTFLLNCFHYTQWKQHVLFCSAGGEGRRQSVCVYIYIFAFFLSRYNFLIIWTLSDITNTRVEDQVDFSDCFLLLGLAILKLTYTLSLW